MCSPSPPPAPDYTGAAEATAEGNIEAQRSATQANRPDEYTPYGSRIWEQDPNNPDSWESRINLSGEGQQIFDADTRARLGMAALGEQGMNQLGGVFQNKFEVDANRPEYQSPGTYGENRSRVMDLMLNRVDEQVGYDKDKARSDLIAQGISPGSEAWQREMKQLDYKQTDARQQAEIAASDQAGREYQSSLAGAGAQYGAESDARGKMIQEMLMNRQTPLNEFNAFRTGSQVDMPQFGSYGNQSASAGADYSGAVGQQSAYDMAGYNADVSQTNQSRGAAAAALAAWISTSDRRLKKNIIEVGAHRLGIPVYEFSYLWNDKRHVGVMAQDLIKVLPKAVITFKSGFMAVNYRMLSCTT